jgi:hypothetical protein
MGSGLAAFRSVDAQWGRSQSRSQPWCRPKNMQAIKEKVNIPGVKISSLEPHWVKSPNLNPPHIKNIKRMNTKKI